MMDAFFLIGAAQGLGVCIKSYFFSFFLMDYVSAFIWPRMRHMFSSLTL